MKNLKGVIEAPRNMLTQSNRIIQEEIRSIKPKLFPDPFLSPKIVAKQKLKEAGYWSKNQQMGRRWAIGCVALEITQRCNLNCSLCYLSKNSKLVKDIPIKEVFRRIELIRKSYGKNTDIQITGGEPALRKKEELLTIVRQIRLMEMRPTLMTNGIKVTRPLLEELAEVGLIDIAFHVDLTQNREEFKTEEELNKIRQKYIDLCEGLPLSVIFNTTIYHGNYHEIPDLVRFFTNNTSVVQMAAFQLQTSTGRSIYKKRAPVITIENVIKQIEIGANTPINFNSSIPGHPQCNRYGLCLEINGNLYDCFDDTVFIGRMLTATSDIEWDRRSHINTIKKIAKWLIVHPSYILQVAKWIGGKVLSAKKDLVGSGGRIRKLSFFIHNFMEPCALQSDRVHTCAFHVMTKDGLISMCLHNARRDDFIFNTKLAS